MHYEYDKRMPYRMTISNFPVRKKGCILKPDMWVAVDAMMLAYSLLSSPPVWRQQTQMPPVPQTAALEYLNKWYQTHEFQSLRIVLVFVFDSRRCPYKVGCSYQSILYHGMKTHIVCFRHADNWNETSESAKPKNRSTTQEL